MALQKVGTTTDGGTMYELDHCVGLIAGLIDYGDRVIVVGRYGCKTYTGSLINAIMCYEAQYGYED